MATRDELKQAALLEAATEIFLRDGYVGTSMDAIAATARVSKQTLYRHFPSKEALFHALVEAALEDPAAERAGPGSIASTEGLRSFARHLLRGVMQEHVVRLRRLVIGEAGRFPALGRAFYEAGPGRLATELSRALDDLVEAGHLRAVDPSVAAQHFISLVVLAPLNRVMFLGHHPDLSGRQLDRQADDAVDAFLAAYGT